MADLWTERDLPVLRHLVERLDALNVNRVTPEEAAAACEIDVDAARRAFRSLADATPPYVVGQRVAQAAYPIFINRLHERAYRAVGAWPTAEGLAQSITDALDRAADTESDPEQKSKLKAVAGWLSGAGRTIVVDVMTRYVERSAGLG
jgi:hypothetical protein